MATGADDLGDVIAFLSDSRAEVRKMAAELVAGLTGSPEGIDKLKGKSGSLLAALLRLIADAPDISRSALTSLVNLSQDERLMQELVESHVPSRCIDYLRDKTCPHQDLLVMLLSNVTMSEKGCKDLLQLGKDNLEGFNMAVLLKMFTAEVESQPDTFEHVAAILTNVSRLEKARQMLLEPGRGLLLALASQLRSESLLRRRGCAATLRNLCLRAEEDKTLPLILAEREVLLAMLEPICGMSQPKDADEVVRESLAEAVLLLVNTEEGRKVMWELKAPEMLRKGYEMEEDPGVCEAMERTASIFLQNSGQVEEEVEAQ